MNPGCKREAVGVGIPSEFGGNLRLQSVSVRAIIGVCRCSSSVEYKLPKLRRRVRFPSSAVCEKNENISFRSFTFLSQNRRDYCEVERNVDRSGGCGICCII